MLGREGLLPNWLAQVHPVRNTPVNATWLTGISSGALLFCPGTSPTRIHCKTTSVPSVQIAHKTIRAHDHFQK